MQLAQKVRLGFQNAPQGFWRSVERPVLSAALLAYHRRLGHPDRYASPLIKSATSVHLLRWGVLPVNTRTLSRAMSASILFRMDGSEHRDRSGFHGWRLNGQMSRGHIPQRRRGPARPAHCSWRGPESALGRGGGGGRGGSGEGASAGGYVLEPQSISPTAKFWASVGRGVCGHGRRGCRRREC